MGWEVVAGHSYTVWGENMSFKNGPGDSQNVQKWSGKMLLGFIYGLGQEHIILMDGPGHSQAA
jgi:hypothetical protein